jgi:UDP-N-acetylmuramyl pentapeptide phosphotransferase/UDP-N-acetylglucosamine-1-phosphate transferase
LAASLMPLSGLYINNLYGLWGIYDIPLWLGAPLTVFVIVFINNAINLIDGIDGLSAGLSLLSLCGFLYCFMNEGLFLYSILITGLIGVLLTFLYFNLFGKVEKGTKIFMGDSGSLTLGFILGFLLVKFSMDNPNIMPFRSDSLMISCTLLMVPVFDVFRVIFVRIIHKQPIFNADKNHIHHKLMRAGLNQHQALIVILLFSMLFMTVNILLSMVLDFSYIIIIDVVIWLLFHYVLNGIIRKNGQKAFQIEKN